METEDQASPLAPHDAPVIPPTKKDKWLPISIIVAAVLVSGAVVFSSLYKPAAQAPAPAPSGSTGPSAAQIAAALTLTSRDVVFGNADAPVTVIEYGDYQCPFCTRYFSTIQPAIEQYANAGKVKFIFRNFPFLDRFPGLPAGANESHDAAAAAECSKDQGKFWAYHNALYQAKLNDEAKGGGENDGLFTRSLFVSIANRLGMDASAFTNCLASGKYTSAVNDGYTAAQNAGVNSTPTTFVNGKEVVDPTGASVGADETAIMQAIQTAINS